MCDSSNPQVLDNFIHHGKNGGAMIHGRATGVFARNLVTENAQAGAHAVVDRETWGWLQTMTSVV